MQRCKGHVSQVDVATKAGTVAPNFVGFRYGNCSRNPADDLKFDMTSEFRENFYLSALVFPA